jgi:hypothetical protein
MTFTVLEWFALVFAIGIIVKIFVISFRPKSWLNFVKKMYRVPMVLFVVELVLALVLIYYLVQQITFVHIVASMALGALLMGMVASLYAKETILLVGDKILRQKGFLRRAWVPVLLWLIVAALALLAIL